MSQQVADTVDADTPRSTNGTDPEDSGGIFRKLRRRPLLVIILVIVVAALAVGGFKAYGYYSVRESTDDAQIDAHVNPISARVSGTVTKVNIEENQYVQAGTVLFEIDPRDYQVSLQHAEANLADAEAAARAAATRVPVTSTTSQSGIQTANAGVQQAQAAAASVGREVEAARARLGSAQAQARQAEANSTKAAQDLERMKILISKDEISRQQYDAAVAAADAARAQREAAESAIREAERGIEAVQARHTQAESGVLRAKAELQATSTAPQEVAISRANAAAAAARVEQARAAVQQAKLNLEYTTVKSPVTGIVGRRNVETGQVVQPGQPLVAIVPMADVWVTANFKETQLHYMKPGQPAVISVDAYGGREYRGHVDSISAATGARFSLLPPENATGNYVKVVQRVPVKILIEKGQDAEDYLRPGMSVYATVRIKQ
jgi:membrane fusion protein, multidrug efflux system